MSDNSKTLREMELSGWFQNDRGWWHPPSCLASWPETEAIAMFLRDKDRVEASRRESRCAVSRDNGNKSIGEAYDAGDEIVIIGDPQDDALLPEDDPRRHNCDAMGCSSTAHVLYRFAKSIGFPSRKGGAQ